MDSSDSDGDGPIGVYPCTFESCEDIFTTEREMKQHKFTARKHEFCCVTCNVECSEWEQLVNHKAATTTVHRSCPMCGLDVKQASTLVKHMNQMHPVNQQIKCIGCDNVFARASGYIYHLECEPCDPCRGKLQQSIIGKRLINRILADDIVRTPFQNNDEGLFDDDDVTDDGTGEMGGTILSPNQLTLEPTHAGNQADYADSEDEIQDRLAASSIADQGDLVENYEDDGQEPIEERVRRSEPFRPILYSSRLGHGNQQKALPIKPPSALTGQNLSALQSSLSQDSFAQSTTGSRQSTRQTSNFGLHDWEAALVKKDAHLNKQDNTTNMWKVHFWDPRSEHYNPERFFDISSETYRCPFPECRDRYSKCPRDLDSHIINIHRYDSVSCPMCKQSFAATYRLVSHWESTNGKCGVQPDSLEANSFRSQMIELTGGFLDCEKAIRRGSQGDYVKWRAIVPPNWSPRPLVVVKREYDRKGKTAQVVEMQLDESGNELPIPGRVLFKKRGVQPFQGPITNKAADPRRVANRSNLEMMERRWKNSGRAKGKHV